MLNKIFSALVSFLVTVVPIILTLHNPPAKQGEPTAVCALSPAEVDMLQSVMQQRNLTCTYNITLDDVLGM